MGIKPEEINRAIAAGNKVLAQLKNVCPKANEYQTSAQLQNPESKPNAASTLVKANARKAKSDTRIIVRFISYRTRLLDADNLAGGSKFLLDSLRYAALIPGDDPSQIVFVTEQHKVAHRREERTEIELLS